MKKIIKLAGIALFAVICHPSFADSKLQWYEMFDSNSNGQVTLKDDTGQAVTAKVNPTGASAKMNVSSATQPAITTRIRLGTATEGTACSTPRDDIALNPARTLVLSCQSGIWVGLGGSPTGMVGYFAASACPTGWLLANGTSGTPDLRGEFIRGWDGGRGVDPGRALGSWQIGSVEAHTHNLFINQGATSGAGQLGLANHGSLSPGGKTFSTSQAGATETRPRNVAMLPCIKQ